MLLAYLSRPESFRAAIRSTHLIAHIARLVLLVSEICLIIYGYTLIDLIESHAGFALLPLAAALLFATLVILTRLTAGN